MKKICTFILLATLFVCAAASASANFDLFDMKYDFKYAYVIIGDTFLVSGKVQSWRDYEDSDMVQVRIDGNTFYTHGSNVILCDKEIK